MLMYCNVHVYIGIGVLIQHMFNTWCTSVHVTCMFSVYVYAATMTPVSPQDEEVLCLRKLHDQRQKRMRILLKEHRLVLKQLKTFTDQDE